MFSYTKYKILIIVVTLICLITIYEYYYEIDYGYFKSKTIRNEQNFVDAIKVTHYELAQNMTKPRSKEKALKNHITNTTRKKSDNGTIKIEMNTIIDPFMCFKNFKASNLIVNNVSDVEIKPGRTIFFLETSCRSNVLNQITLNARQGCAIESAAISHPNLDIVILVLASNVLGSHMDPVVNILLNNYKHIRILHANLDQYFEGTPVENLHTSGRMLESYYPMIHMSDVLRYITMWKYGGIYLDLDVLITKNLEDLGPNFTGLENSVTIAAGLLGFDAKGLGHSWVESILNKINITYKPNAWSYNALEVLQMELEKVCNTTRITEMTRENCQGFNILPKLAFYEIGWNIWNFFFEANHTDYVMNIMPKPEVKAAHLWNKLSQNGIPEKNSAYRILAGKYCPHVYSITKNNF